MDKSTDLSNPGDIQKYTLPPNAKTQFEDIRKLLQGKRPVIFLDYDGTLAPIVSRPDQAFMTETMRAAVKTVAQKFTTAVVSGRSTAKVINFVQLDELFYAGSHGLDITGPSNVDATQRRHRSGGVEDGGGGGGGSGSSPDDNGAGENKENTDDPISLRKRTASGLGEDGKSEPPVKHRVASTFLPVLNSCRNKILNSIESKLGTDSMVEIEDNLLTFSVHYRNAINFSAEQVREVIDAILIEKEYENTLICTAGKMVYEVRPQVEWNKGAAVLWLLETLGLNDLDNVIPLYLGDDVTDEDAFLALSKSNWKGKYASIVVQGEKDTVVGEGLVGVGCMHRNTNALWSLRGTEEVQGFLELIGGL